jgi:uncharacterized membrane protein YeaQ/YmgE (transglycosylase-associated protein family)
MRAATSSETANPIRMRDFAWLTFGDDKVFARHRSPSDVGRSGASPAIDAMTIDQRSWSALQRVSCPAANASTDKFHIISLTQKSSATQFKKSLVNCETPGHTRQLSAGKQRKEIMIHLIWYIIVGLIAGVIAKSVMHVHMTIFWTIVLGIIGSIIGGAVTHMFSHPTTGRFHPAGLIFSTLGAILVLYFCIRLNIRFPRVL